MARKSNKVTKLGQSFKKLSKVEDYLDDLLEQQLQDILDPQERETKIKSVAEILVKLAEGKRKICETLENIDRKQEPTKDTEAIDFDMTLTDLMKEEVPNTRPDPIMDMPSIKGSKKSNGPN